MRRRKGGGGEVGIDVDAASRFSCYDKSGGAAEGSVFFWCSHGKIGVWVGTQTNTSGTQN